MKHPLKDAADLLASRGRYGDTMLVHMNPAEVEGLASLSPTGKLTINPDTGQPEAFLPMLLPLLGGLGGAALAPTLGIGAALGGAIGSGLGSFAATGDVGKGIMSGILGYGLGSAGELLAGGVPGAAAETAAQAGAAAAAAPQVASSSVEGLIGANAMPHVAGDLIAPGATSVMNSGAQALNTGSQSYLSRVAENIMKPGALAHTFVDNAMKTTLPIGLGLYGMMGSDEGGQPMPQQPMYRNTPSMNHTSGRRYLGPGTPDPYGTERRYFGYATGGQVSGPGSGLDDAIPAIVNGRQPAALSDGEYVVPAHAVSALGNGSTDEGVRQLDGMVDRVMTHKFGSKNRKPKPLNVAKVMPKGAASGTRPFASGGFVQNIMDGRATMQDYLQAYAMLQSPKRRDRLSLPVEEDPWVPEPALMSPHSTPKGVEPDEDLESARERISRIESGGNYKALGPMVGKDRAYGRYQVMGANIPSWTKDALGRSLTPEEYLADKEAQDAVFNHRFGGYLKKYGSKGAARAWFAGEGGMNNYGAKDVLGTSVADYERKFGYADGGLIDETMMFLGLKERPLDPQRSWDMDVPPRKWPTKDEVYAARDYQRKYGHPFLKMAQGPQALNLDNPNVTYEEPGTPVQAVSPDWVVDFVNTRDKRGVAAARMSRETADELYAAQLAGQEDPFAVLGFDPSRTVVTQPRMGRRYTVAGAYWPRADEIWLGEQSPSTPIHESIHRGRQIMRSLGPEYLEGNNKGIEPYQEEYMVRRLMRKAVGPVESEENAAITTDKNRWDPALVWAEGDNPDADKYIKKIKKKAHHEIARRTIDKAGGVR